MAAMMAHVAKMTDYGLEDPGASEAQARFDAGVAQMATRTADLESAKETQASHEALRDSYVAKANDLASYLHQKERRLSMAGDLVAELATAKAQYEAHNNEGAAKLAAVGAAHDAMLDANVHASTKTPLTFASVTSDFNAVTELLKKKQSDIQSAIAQKEHTGVSAEQLAEFKESFDFFDKDNSGALSHLELKGCLQSLGEEPDDAALAAIVERLDTDKDGTIGFDEFMAYVITLNRDNDTEDEIVTAFKTLTDGRDFITEAEMRSVMDNEQVTYLIAAMPKNADGTFNYKGWTSSAYGQ